MYFGIAASMLMRTAGAFGTMMLRMYVLALQSFNESHHKTLTASAAGMNIETNDTH
jgi:hypothetical protein